MKKSVVSFLAAIILALSCLAMSACDLLGLGGGNASAKFVGTWKFQSLTEADGTEYKTGDFYHGNEPNNELMADSFSLELREQEVYQGDGTKKVRNFQLRNWLTYPDDLQGSFYGSWSADGSKVTMTGMSGKTHYGTLKDGVLAIEYSGVYTVYLVKS